MYRLGSMWGASLELAATLASDGTIAINSRAAAIRCGDSGKRTALMRGFLYGIVMRAAQATRPSKMKEEGRRKEEEMIGFARAAEFATRASSSLFVIRF